MNSEVLAACIQAAGTLIAGGAAAYSLMHRRDVILLASEVAAYHDIEGEYVKELMRLHGAEITESSLRHQRGFWRNKLCKNSRPSLTRMQALAMKKKYLSFD